MIMSLETGVAIFTPNSCGVPARSTTKLPFDCGCNDRPARRKFYIDAFSDVATAAGAQEVKLFLYARKAIQPQYDANNPFFVQLYFERYNLINYSQFRLLFAEDRSFESNFD